MMVDLPFLIVAAILWACGRFGSGVTRFAHEPSPKRRCRQMIVDCPS